MKALEWIWFAKIVTCMIPDFVKDMGPFEIPCIGHYIIASLDRITR